MSSIPRPSRLLLDSGVRPAGLRPLARDALEVSDVAADENVLLARGHLKQTIVFHDVENIAFGVCGADVVSGRGETLLFPPGLDHAEFGAIVSGVEALLADTDQSGWQDRFEWMARASG
jgi:hypothetical protein